MLSDIEISQQAKASKIFDIAEKLDIKRDDLYLFGDYKCKVNHNLLKEHENNNDGKLILVTAISPTPAGEGKTTTTIGLGDALNKLNKKTAICLREPSLGPVFGMKGGATGGGYSQVIPMEDINLHFTGDLHAIGACNNLLAAVIDNHIHQGNELNIDPRRITWRRAMDMNDRQLRNIVCGIGNIADGTPRTDGFDITVASEIMAIFCLSKNLRELKDNLSKIIIGYTFHNNPVTCGQLNIVGALAALLKDAFNPNLVQTLEGSPTFVHGGPFANIAHGCNSVIATKLALKLSDYVVTEAGFGADLGAEKFFDIKCRKNNLKPSAVVLVATIRALKYHGGQILKDLHTENLDALKNGSANLEKHISNIKNVFGLNCVVAINRFPSDTENEINLLKNICETLGVEVSLSEVFNKGSDGGIDLAEKVIALTNEQNNFKFAYDDNVSVREKIESVAKNIYGAKSVNISSKTLKSLREFEMLGYGNLPVCIAKTQYSFSDNPKLLGVAKDFELNVSDVKLSAGAGFIVVLTGAIMTMPGLPKIPQAEKIDIDEEGNITGLF